MTRDEIKQLLHQYRDLKAERAQIVEQLQKLTDPRTPTLTGMPRGNGGNGDPMAGIVSKRMALQERYWAQLEELASAAAAIEDMIETLSPLERRLMRCRYIEGKSWEAVCIAINYSWRRTHELHSAALDKLVAAENEKEVTR